MKLILTASYPACATIPPPSLQYLDRQGLTIGKKINVVDIIEFDRSMVLQMEDKTVQISREVANNLLITL